MLALPSCEPRSLPKRWPWLQGEAVVRAMRNRGTECCSKHNQAFGIMIESGHGQMLEAEQS